jgi:hypothetical protein
MVKGNKECGSVDTLATAELCSNSWSRSEKVAIEAGEEDDLENFCRQAFYGRWGEWRWVGCAGDADGTRTLRGWGKVGWFERIACH